MGIAFFCFFHVSYSYVSWMCFSSHHVTALTKGGTGGGCLELSIRWFLHTNSWTTYYCNVYCPTSELCSVGAEGPGPYSTSIGQGLPCFFFCNSSTACLPRNSISRRSCPTSIPSSVFFRTCIPLRAKCKLCRWGHSLMICSSPMLDLWPTGHVIVDVLVFFFSFFFCADFVSEVDVLE